MAFAKLWKSWDIDEEAFNVLQEFVTELCGMNMIDVVKTDKKTLCNLLQIAQTRWIK